MLLVKRPENGLLGGMLEPPMGPWRETFRQRRRRFGTAPFDADWTKRAGVVRHGFTHFELEIEVYVAAIGRRPRAEGSWIARDRLADVALPTIMRKVVAHGLDDGGPLFAQPSSARMR